MLIPSITISEFRKLKASEIKGMKSVEVTSDGETLFMLIKPSTDYIKTQAEYLGVKSNSIDGKDPSEVVNADIPVSV